MENKQSQNPSKSSTSQASGMYKKSASQVGTQEQIGADEFDIETKHPSSGDSNVVSGGDSKDASSCSTGCGTKQ